MSKKKATMTLKDFHGGSIPSDLPLPSAPGVIVRPSDRSGYDRQISWGNPTGKSDPRLRPGSAGTARNYDDKIPFLSHSSHIGRNFDEDERKPLDGVSGPRRTVSDESLRGLPSRLEEPKPDNSAMGRFSSRPASTPGSQYSSSSGSNSYAGRFPEVNNVGASSQGFGGSRGVGGPSGQVVPGQHPNAWGLRKEAAVLKEAAPTAWSATDAASKLAHASALEKVSSGRWHYKQQMTPQTDVEVIRHPETEIEFHSKDSDMYSKNAYNTRDLAGRADYRDLALAKHAEKSLNIDEGICAGGKEIPIYQRPGHSMYMEGNEMFTSGNVNGFRSPHNAGKPGGSELQSAMPSDTSERPKLKLLPRSQPLENQMPMDYKQDYQQPSAPVHAENHTELRGITNPLKAGFVGSDSGYVVEEHPKFNPAAIPGSQYSSSSGISSYTGRFAEVNNALVSSQGFGGSSGVGFSYENVGGPSGQVVSGQYPNAWGLRKEAVGIKEPVPSVSSAPDAESKLARASALEKVSSGRWHSKQQMTHIDAEVVRHPETEGEFYSRDSNIHGRNAYNARDFEGRADYHVVAQEKHIEKSLNIDDGISGGGKEIPIYGRARPPMYVEANERNPSGNANGFQSLHSVGRPGGSDLLSAMPSDASDRPKLKLLPRSKPLENQESPMDFKQGYRQPSAPVHAGNHIELHGITDPVKAGFVGSESGYVAVDRPKLNLRPRAGPLEQFEDDPEGKKNTLFGGARPRELVLKERGFGTVAINNDDLLQTPYWNKQDDTKVEKMSMHATAAWHNDKSENITVEQRVGKNFDRRDHRLDAERTDVQRRNWRGENWRNKREFEKQQQQERPPSPESWRKPVEQPKSASPDTSGLRYGKAASALELAQAFSKSISDPADADGFSGQRGLPSRQMPFSRLMGSTARPQINGY